MGQPPWGGGAAAPKGRAWGEHMNVWGGGVARRRVVGSERGSPGGGPTTIPRRPAVPGAVPVPRARPTLAARSLRSLLRSVTRRSGRRSGCRSGSGSSAGCLRREPHSSCPLPAPQPAGEKVRGRRRGGQGGGGRDSTGEPFAWVAGARLPPTSTPMRVGRTGRGSGRPLPPAVPALPLPPPPPRRHSRLCGCRSGSSRPPFPIPRPADPRRVLRTAASVSRAQAAPQPIGRPCPAPGSQWRRRAGPGRGQWGASPISPLALAAAR